MERLAVFQVFKNQKPLLRRDSVTKTMDNSRPLEETVNLKMTVFMFLFGMIFLLSPDTETFRILARGGWRVLPAVLGLFCFGTSLGYMFLMSAASRQLSIRIRRTIFIVASTPVAFYFTILGYIALKQQLNFLPLTYAAIYATIFFLAFAIYNGYSRLLEYIVTGLMIVLMALSALAFAFSPITAMFRTFHLSPFSFSLICILATVGFSLELHQSVRKLPVLMRRLIFIISEIPIALYALFLIVYVFHTGAPGIIMPTLLLALYLLISLFAYVLYQPEPTSPK